MSLKTKLFASVAGPVLSLPLLIQPVYAVPTGLDITSPQAKSHVLRVQQEVVPEEEGQERPRRRAQEGGGEEGGQERPRRQRDAEQSQEGERPRRQQQESQQSGEGERPRRQQQSEQAPEGERPRRQQQTEQAPEGERPRRQQGETQSGESERPRRQQQETQQSEENQRPQRREQQSEQVPAGEGQQRRQQQQTGQSEESERPRRQQQQSEQAPEGEGQQRRQQRDTQQSQENERPRRQQDQNATTGTQGGSGERNQARPTREQPDQDNAASPATREQRAREGQATEQSPTREQEAPAARAAGGERERRQAPAAQGEQPTLPVENGAAVLDSAKEQRPERQRREGDRPRRDQDQQADQQRAAPPRSDAEAQRGRDITDEQREQWRNQRRELAEERGERLDRRPDFERPRGWDVRGPARGGDRDRDRDDSRVIISIDNQEFVRHNDSRRFYRDGREPEYERLGDGRVREIVEREDGTRVITVRNRYGEVVQRSRVARGGDEYVLYYAPELLEDDRDRTWRDPGEDLPPMRLTVPVEDYIIDTSSEPDRDYYEFLEQPPVEQVERVYSLDEVRYSARIRDKVPRIDLDTITFATGSAEVPANQANSLGKVADAIKKVLDQDPSETFLIEGHTDAVGSDQDNLVLSDERAESVAVVLSDEFGIPPENLTTQGYGEQYLKVKTDSANQENRRVTIRRITPLVKPVASAQ